MALAPKFNGHRLTITPPGASSTSLGDAAHTLEIYLDYVCPYSAKLYKTLYSTVLPSLSANPLPTPLHIIFRQQIQPWHPSSTLTHESALAVLRLTGNNSNSNSSSSFWAFSSALFASQTAYFDVNVVNEPRNETYRRLAKLAASTEGVVGVSEDDMYSLLAVPDKAAEDGSLNVGNAVTNDVKVIVKLGRLAGVHVSPTVVFDGVPVGEISSSWTGEQWGEWLGKNVV